MERLLLVALGLGLTGGLFLWWAFRARVPRGLGSGETVALDDVLLSSERLNLVGRPDRIERRGEFLIPEEWKPSAKRVYPGHRLQLGAYFLLIEEEFGIRPPFGIVVIQGGERVEVANTASLRTEVLTMAAKIREHRRESERVILMRALPFKCRTCGQRRHCKQASA